MSFFENDGKHIESMKMLYRGSEEEFDAFRFHENCDNGGPTLCVAQSSHTHVFGGFTKCSWKDESVSKSGQWKEDLSAFIYLLRSPKEDVLPEKWNVVAEKKEKTIRCDNGYGPVFGYGYDLRICNECDKKQDSSSQLDNDDACFGAPAEDDFLTGEFYFLVTEYEVYQVNM
eukprot:UN08132